MYFHHINHSFGGFVGTNFFILHKILMLDLVVLEIVIMRCFWKWCAQNMFQLICSFAKFFQNPQNYISFHFLCPACSVFFSVLSSQTASYTSSVSSKRYCLCLFLSPSLSSTIFLHSLSQLNFISSNDDSKIFRPPQVPSNAWSDCRCCPPLSVLT